MIVQEPVQAAIWHCLNHYAYQDATFLAERLYSEVETEESIFLLATCYYRSGQIHQAFWLLQSKGARSPQCRFLMAKCAYDLKKIHPAETSLSNEDFTKLKNFDDICKDFGDTACFALQLIAKICAKTERAALATDAHKRALKLNPFLWQSFADLCNRGDKPDPNIIFQFANTDTFSTCQGHNTNNIIWFGNNDSHMEVMNSSTVYNSSILTTPVDQCIIQTGMPVVTPQMRIIVNEETPICNNSNIIGSDTGGIECGTPFKKQFKYLSALSPITPSFGVLPLQSPNDSSLLFTPSPQTLVEANDQKLIGKKLKGHVGSVINRKDGPLQQSKPIFSQTGNLTPRQQNSLTGQNVRRSSRLFSSNYSVKENSKSSPNINKFATPRSPPRKTKQRISKINSTLNELNEKQKVEKEKIETVTSADSKVLLNNSINSAQSIAQHVLNLKKQSAEGLMSLLRELGQGYVQLSQYNCKEAIEHFSNVPHQHFKSSWVQSMIALAHHEQREYEAAARIFKEIHEHEPNRLHLMEIYSTTLWHLQREVSLSALAQDLMAQDKTSPITWCVAGNCFSLHKEHEAAIKFFQRAVQVDPDFVYSYTLLGHELVITEELDKALSCFRTAILKDWRHYNAWFGIGTIFSKQERFQLAEMHYRRALQINPKNSVIMVHIGVMQLFLKKLELALQTLNTAIKLDPKNPLCKFHRSTLYFAMRKNQEALQELEELKEIVPKESVVYYLIGKIHKSLGNADLALMHFSWATDLDPKGANNQIKEAFDTTGAAAGACGMATSGLGNSSVAAASTTTSVPGVNIDLNVDQDREQTSERSDDSTQVRNGEADIHVNPYDSDSF